MKSSALSQRSPDPLPVRLPARRRGTCLRWSLASALLVILVGIGGLRFIHPFLATTRPVQADYLVVEGWLPDYALEAALAELRRGGYNRLYTTGGPLPRGSFLAEYHSYPQVAAATLLKLGIATNQVIAVEAGLHHRNRTFASAVAFREYCRAEGMPLHAINLVSLGAHARRSRLCFRRALGPQVELGVISIENKEYDPKRWWRFSEGVKTVGGEILALTYAWLSLDYGN